jgi:hypothetical protein
LQSINLLLLVDAFHVPSGNEAVARAAFSVVSLSKVFQYRRRFAFSFQSSPVAAAAAAAAARHLRELPVSVAIGHQKQRNEGGSLDISV